MDNIPSKSISKSLLIATPLFLIIMAVLNTSNQISYLFVLDFVNNIGGKADIMFLPTVQPEIHTDDPYQELLRMGSDIQDNKTTGFMQQASVPLINMSHVREWQQRNQLVKGTAPRWLVPIVADKTNIDSLIMIMNISKENYMGSSIQANLQPLEQDEIAIPQQILSRLPTTTVGSSLTIKLAIKNLFNGMKLIEKFQDPTSNDQFTTDSPQLNLTKIIKETYKQLNSSFNIASQINQQQFEKIVMALYNAQLTKQFKIKYVYKENGLYPNALHNVIVMEYKAFSNMLWEFLKNNIVLNKELNLTQYIPKEYRPVWNIATKSTAYDEQAETQLAQLLQEYCVIAVSLFNNRQLLYHPKQPLMEQFSRALQKSPENVQVIALYPFYQQSLNIKYFFGSVIQIFEVVTCVIYFFTMSLIMKQIYQEKEIEVGIWRTLGAGGVKQRSIKDNDQFSRNPLSSVSQNNELNNSSQPPLIAYRLNQKLTLKQKARHWIKILIKIGFMYYWLASSLISILIYMVIKYFMIDVICNLLYFAPIQQNFTSAFWLFVAVFGLSQFFVLTHIRNIYVAPLSLTIKPLKRTFDEVKIRVIHLSTFGVSSSTLLIAVMLIYYGVVSYYWIPFAILDNDGDLQIILFNSIFIFMIFGSIILIAVLQSRFERLILRGLSSLNQRLSKIKSIMLKNIKAKQYKNIKMSIIIAVTFAFLLFFSTGINIEIMIVQSFIERQLGAELVLENYEKKSFDQEKIQEYLDTIPNVKYSWISSDINSDDIKLQLINQMDPIRKIFCQWKVMTPNYLDSSYYKYYYPQNYMVDNISSYRVLPNGVINGFDALYKYDGNFNNESIGKYDPQDTMTDFDPHQINVFHENMAVQDMLSINEMAPNEQIINFAASSLLKLQMGSNVGDLYKMRITSKSIPYYLNIRSRIVHSYKVGPGMDLLRPQAFITQQQAKYLLKILGHNQTITYEKLLIQGPSDQLKQIGNRILSMSPEHTEMFEMKIVAQSFELLEKYLSFYIVLIATIMGTLAVLFVFLYTLGKCRDEAEMYKMLRAIGVSVTDLRIMIFLEILIRLFVSITNGILLGIVFSLGFGMQIEELLMINTPGMDLSLIMKIAAVMFVVFCVTVYLATRYLTKKTVADTARN